MIRKYLLLEPSANTETGGTSAPSKVPPPRTPTAEDLKVNFDITDADDLGLDDPVSTDEVSSKPKAEIAAGETKQSTTTQVKATGEQSKPTTEVELPTGELEKTTETKPAVNPLGEQVKPAARDYTGFTEAETKVLKQMSNQSFEYATKLIRENRELAKAKNDVYLQHPQAVYLDPAFQKIAEDAHYAEQDAQQWRNQLLKIKANQAWHEFLGWDKDNKPVYGPPQQPTDEAEIRVQQNMMQAQQMAGQFKGQQQAFQQQYNQRIQQDNSSIDQVQAQKFSWCADPKLLDTVINVPKVGERSFRQIREDFTNLLPTYMRNHKLAEVAGNMFVALQIYGAEIQKLSQTTQQAVAKQAEILRAEPTSTTRKPAEKGGLDKRGWASSFEDLPPM